MKIIRFALILYLLTLIGETASAQNLKLSDEPGQFMVQFRKLMDGSRNPQYIRSAAQMDSIWMSAISAPQQAKFIGIIKTQIAKGQKAGPVLFLLTEIRIHLPNNLLKTWTVS
jgi:hypothetical protein